MKTPEQLQSMCEKARSIASEIKSKPTQCNCDLDNWVPERLTGHSWVCRIHKATMERLKR